MAYCSLTSSDRTGTSKSKRGGMKSGTLYSEECISWPKSSTSRYAIGYIFKGSRILLEEGYVIFLVEKYRFAEVIGQIKRKLTALHVGS